MIAMGVLAVGMGMVAGALHAGIQTHVRNIDDIMRQLIGDNSLAIVQASIRHSPGNGITDHYRSLDSTFLSPANLKFPFNANTPYGAVVFIKARMGANDYTVLVVPYRIVPNSATQTTFGNVAPTTINSCSITNVGETSKLTTSTALELGAVVIDNSDGKVAVITGRDVSPNIYILSNKLNAADGTATITTLAPPANCRLECSKPVRTQTALPPDPRWVPTP